MKTVISYLLLMVFVVSSTALGGKKIPADTYKKIESKMSVKADLSSKKYVILYFANKDCPHCQRFQSEIVKMYKKWSGHKDKFEFIYVSESDKSSAIKAVGSKLPFPYLKVSKRKIAVINKINPNDGTPLIYIFDDKMEQRGSGIAGRMLPQIDRVFTTEFKK